MGARHCKYCSIKDLLLALFQEHNRNLIGVIESLQGHIISQEHCGVPQSSPSCFECQPETISFTLIHRNADSYSQLNDTLLKTLSQKPSTHCAHRSMIPAAASKAVEVPAMAALDGSGSFGPGIDIDSSSLRPSPSIPK